MDYTRLKQWIDASQVLSRLDELMLIPAQQLGRLDCQLAAESPSFANAGTNVERAHAFQTHLTLSYLWVLGGYELVRVMNERYKADPHLVSVDLQTRTRNVKKGFERVRIPLAKFQPARAHADTDFTFAWPAYDPERGVAWVVAPNVIVSRQELADELLRLLEALRRTVTL